MISPPARVARAGQTIWLMFALAKRTLPSPIRMLHPPGCSAYIWQSLQRRALGGWTSGGFSQGFGPLWQRTWVAATSQNENANRGVGQPMAPGNHPDPRLVAQNRAVLADEDRVGKPVRHRGGRRP